MTCLAVANLEAIKQCHQPSSSKLPVLFYLRWIYQRETPTCSTVESLEATNASLPVKYQQGTTATSPPKYQQATSTMLSAKDLLATTKIFSNSHSNFIHRDPETQTTCPTVESYQLIFTSKVSARCHFNFTSQVSASH